MAALCPCLRWPPSSADGAYPDCFHKDQTISLAWWVTN